MRKIVINVLVVNDDGSEHGGELTFDPDEHGLDGVPEEIRPFVIGAHVGAEIAARIMDLDQHDPHPPEQAPFIGFRTIGKN